LYVVDRLRTGFKIENEISSKTTKKLLKYITDKDTEDDINIIIDCEGGHIEASLNMYDILKSLPKEQKIFTFAMGKCWSAANIIFCAASNSHNRIAFKSTSFMIHNVITSFDEDDINVIHSAVRHTLDLQEKMYSIIGNCMIIDPRVKVKDDHEWYMDGNVAFQYGYTRKVV